MILQSISYFIIFYFLTPHLISVIMPLMIHEDQVIRSRRRSIALEIKDDGRLMIRAPQHASLAEIDAFVTSKQKWISEKQAAARKRSANSPHPVWEEGSFIPFLGMRIKLCYHDRDVIKLEGPEELPGACDHPALFDINDNIHLYIPDLRMRVREFRLNYYVDHDTEITQNMLMIKHWYKSVAAGILKDRTGLYESATGLKSHSIKITSAKRKWGSCSSKKDIIFSHQLICLSFYEIDYVIVHELTHILHMDHSRRFYEDLGKILPDYKLREDALQKYNSILSEF